MQDLWRRSAEIDKICWKKEKSKFDQDVRQTHSVAAACSHRALNKKDDDEGKDIALLAWCQSRQLATATAPTYQRSRQTRQTLASQSTSQPACLWVVVPTLRDQHAWLRWRQQQQLQHHMCTAVHERAVGCDLSVRLPHCLSVCAYLLTYRVYVCMYVCMYTYVCMFVCSSVHSLFIE